MILRRMREAVTEQNWFLVAIEILVVVVGIFIGLQVDGWNTARMDRKDEQEFLQRLHVDVLRAEVLTKRVRARRLDRLRIILEANDVLFDRAGRATLTEEECIAIGSANFFNIIAPDLPSVEELIGTGRLGIIRDAQLRSALIGLRQTRAALSSMVAIQSGSSTFTHLPSNYPDLMQLTAYYDPERGEIRNRSTCDLAGMRKNQKFLNQWSVNTDGYDAYIRDGLAPWSEGFDNVHQILDADLGIEHRIQP